jgi:hypothetical protein
MPNTTSMLRRERAIFHPSPFVDRDSRRSRTDDGRVLAPRVPSEAEDLGGTRAFLDEAVRESEADVGIERDRSVERLDSRPATPGD